MIRPREDFVPPASPAAAGEVQPARPGPPDVPTPDSVATWNVDQLPPELEYFRTSEAYQVELEAFQGPLDLLLFLIQKDELDIYDIPIASITDQFLQYLEIIKLLPLDNAGDFLVMAATLLRIKTHLLLPGEIAEELSEEDPRAELVRRLLEYKRFKDAAQHLRHCEDERRRYHLRQTRYPFLDQLHLDPPLRIEMFDLLAALADVFDRLDSRPVHAVKREQFTVEQKIDLIFARLKDEETILFRDLFADDAIKMEVIVTFIAMLELVKRGLLGFFQTESRGPIWMRLNEPLAAEDSADPDDPIVKREVEAKA